MRLFWEICRISFRRQMAYRAANWAGLFTNLFFGLLRAALLLALYGSRHEVVGITKAGAVTFTGLTQAIIAFLYIFGSYSGLMSAVYSGEIAADLLKPSDFFLFWMAKDLGGSLVSLFMRGLTIMAAYALVFPIVYPAGPGQWAAFLFSLSLAWIISFEWRFLVNLAAFWTPNAQGIGRMAFTFSWFLSGFVMPLRFFPGWFERICAFTPFPSMVNSAMEIYLGVARGDALLRALFFQLLWVLILVAACGITLRAGVRKLVIQGG
jgi:ABC-2 type transport system permease protein